MPLCFHFSSCHWIQTHRLNFQQPTVQINQHVIMIIPDLRNSEKNFPLVFFFLQLSNIYCFVILFFALYSACSWSLGFYWKLFNLTKFLKCTNNLIVFHLWSSSYDMVWLLYQTAYISFCLQMEVVSTFVETIKTEILIEQLDSFHFFFLWSDWLISFKS